MSNLNEIDFHNVCRTCLSTANLNSLYGEKSTHNCFDQILMICTSLECFENDGLPVQICAACIADLNRSYEFASKCRETDEKLRIYRQKLIPEKYAIPHCANSSNDPNCETSRALRALRLPELQNESNLEMLMVKNDTDLTIKTEPDSSLTDSCETVLIHSDVQFNDNLKPIVKETPIYQFNPKGGEEEVVAERMYCNKTGEKPYSCIVCNKSFARRKYFDSHMRTHTTKEKPDSVSDSSIKSKIIYKRFKYSEEQLKEAIGDIRQGKLTQNAASIKYGIPKGTLNMKVRNLVPMERKMGPDTVVTKSDETKICDWLISKAKLGFPMHPTDVQDAIQVVMNETKRANVFKNNRPGIKWLKLFLKRHPEVARRNKEIMAKERGPATEHSIKTWFAEFKQYIDSGGYSEVLKHPARVFSADETGVQFCTTSGYLLGPKRYRHLSESGCKDKECVTVLCNYSAAGLKVPPMIVMPYTKMPTDVAASIPYTFFVGTSASGWMVSDTFYEYIVNCFHPWLILNHIQLPVILFLDGHKSHINVQLYEFCVQKQILIYCIPPNAIKIMQPCDFSIFKTLKHSWMAEHLHFKHKPHTAIPITKFTMTAIFKKAFDTSITPDVIINGFRACGLYPMDPIHTLNKLCISQSCKTKTKLSLLH